MRYDIYQSLFRISYAQTQWNMSCELLFDSRRIWFNSQDPELNELFGEWWIYAYRTQFKMYLSQEAFISHDLFFTWNIWKREKKRFHSRNNHCISIQFLDVLIFRIWNHPTDIFPLTIDHWLSFKRI